MLNILSNLKTITPSPQAGILEITPSPQAALSPLTGGARNSFYSGYVPCLPCVRGGAERNEAEGLILKKGRCPKAGGGCRENKLCSL